MSLLSKTNQQTCPSTISLLIGAVITVASLYTVTVNAASIYKVVDEKTGQVTFTDRPQNYEQQANKQVTQTTVTTGNSSSTASNNTNSDSNSTGSTSSKTATNNQELSPQPTLKVAVNYQLTITEPGEERAYRRPAQSIIVTAQTKPALQVGDYASIYFDGNEIAQGLNAVIATVDILPGEHNVQAVIKNKEGSILQQVSRTVYVIQNTTTLQNNKKIAQQLLAYQNLPWHQKMLLKLRRDKAANPLAK